MKKKNRKLPGAPKERDYRKRAKSYVTAKEGWLQKMTSSETTLNSNDQLAVVKWACDTGRCDSRAWSENSSELIIDVRIETSGITSISVANRRTGIGCWFEVNIEDIPIIIKEQRMREMNGKMWKNANLGILPGSIAEWTMNPPNIEPKSPLEEVSEELVKAKKLIEKQNAVLENIKKEPLLLYSIDRINGKHAYIKKGDQTIRIEAVDNLQDRDEVLLHPKTMQIVERIGKPPLEVSRFCLESVPDVTWDDIGGLEHAKADMIEAVEMPHKHKELFRHYRKRSIKGIMLAGPPGCGKTMLGKAAANSIAAVYGKDKSRTGFLYVKGPEILNMYVGSSEETIRDMFWDARRHHEEHGYPAIIFIDEADAVMAKRGGNHGGIGGTIVPMFLTEMDGIESSSAIVIIATNRPDILDPAIVRDGRIDRKITVSRPKLENARQILFMALNKFPVAKEYDIGVLAEDTAAEIYSDDRFVKGDTRLRDIVNGAMLAGCVDLAVSAAVRRDIANNTATGIVADDLLEAIDRIQRQNHLVVHDLQEAA